LHGLGLLLCLGGRIDCACRVVNTTVIQVDEKGAEAAAATVVMIDLSHWWATVATRATNSFTSPLAVFASDVLMNNFCFAHYNTRMWPTDVRCSTSRSRKPDIRFCSHSSRTAVTCFSSAVTQYLLRSLCHARLSIHLCDAL
jgi:hypothetical protein